MSSRETFLGALDSLQERNRPFRHWLLERALPQDVCGSLVALPFDPPEVEDNEGKRETYNNERHFFSAENRRRFPLCDEIAGLMQAGETLRRVERLCGISLAGSYLRIEYCIDHAEFWLEPHTDISAKLFTMQIYLNDEEGADTLGTDLYDRDRAWVTRIPAGRGRGYILIPGPDTIHGFQKREFAGLRKSLIVNYVKDEWRARHELAFPDQPIAN